MPEHGLPMPASVKTDVEDPQGGSQQPSRYYPEFYNKVPYLVIFDFLIRPWAYLSASKLSCVRYFVAGCGSLPRPTMTMPAHRCRRKWLPSLQLGVSRVIHFKLVMRVNIPPPLASYLDTYSNRLDWCTLCTIVRLLQSGS